MASEIDGRVREITEEVRQVYEKEVQTGVAQPDTFEIFVLRPSRQERRVKWNYKINTQTGPMIRIGQRELTMY